MREPAADLGETILVADDDDDDDDGAASDSDDGATPNAEPTATYMPSGAEIVRK